MAEHTAPLFDQDGEITGGGHPNYTTPQMAIGGTDTFPFEDAGVGASAPDLTPGELGAVGGAKASKRRTYSVMKVMNGPMPSENAKYVGSTPSAAVNKAARRVFKKSGTKDFTVLMRRVSPKHIERELYQYDVRIVPAKKVEGFVTIAVDTFTNVDAAPQSEVGKKVRIVQSSNHPVWGYLQEGRGIEAGTPSQGDFPLVRGEGTNTLTLVIPGDMPDVVQGVRVNKTEWDVVATRSASISLEDRAAFDTASHVKEREAQSLQHKKEREVSKRESERQKVKDAKAKQVEKERAQSAKAKLADTKTRNRERERSAKARALERERVKKQRDEAAAAAARMRASRRA
jgi:hypothetical protein